MQRLAVLALAGVLLSACGGGDATDQRTPAERLAAAKTRLDETPGVRIDLATDILPQGVSGLISAQGVGTHAPAFQGGITVAYSGITADVDVVAVDEVVHAKLPFTTDFVPVDPSDYGAPDPAALMSTDGGLSSLLTAAQDVEAGDRVRDGEAVLSSYTATVPGKAVAAVIPSASETADFDATFSLTDSDQLTSVRLSGPFYPKAGDVTYTVKFSQYGVTKDIKAP
jgi:lipoprotein LprG